MIRKGIPREGETVANADRSDHPWPRLRNQTKFKLLLASAHVRSHMYISLKNKTSTMLCWGLKNMHKRAVSHQDGVKGQNLVHFTHHLCHSCRPNYSRATCGGAEVQEGNEKLPVLEGITFIPNNQASIAHPRREGAGPSAVCPGRWMCGPDDRKIAMPRTAWVEPPSAKQNVQARAARVEPLPEPGTRSPLPRTPLPRTPPKPPKGRAPARPHPLCLPWTRGGAHFSRQATPKAFSAIMANQAHLSRPLAPHLRRVPPAASGPRTPPSWAFSHKSSRALAPPPGACAESQI